MSLPIAQSEKTPTARTLRKWQLVEDARGGRFIVLGGDGVDAEGNRRYKIVRDFTRRLDEESYGTTDMDEERLRMLRENCEANRPHIETSAGDAPPSDIAYLVGSGPSLRHNHAELANAKRGVVIGVNHVASVIDTEYLDYFFCIDRALSERYFRRDMNQTVAILDPTVTPAVHRVTWKAKRWCVPASRSTFYDGVREDFPHLVRVEHGLNVTFTALCWIVRVLKAKTIVLVGMDCAFRDGMRHCHEDPLIFDRDEDYYVAPDLDGRAVITTRLMLDQAEWHAAAFWFLKDAGIRVVNATEGGILTNFVERRRLADAVSELNACEPTEPNDEALKLKLDSDPNTE